MYSIVFGMILMTLSTISPFYHLFSTSVLASSSSGADIASELLQGNSNASSVLIGGTIASVQKMTAPPDSILSGYWKINLGSITEDNNPIPEQGLFSALFQKVMTNGSLPQIIRISDGILSSSSLLGENIATFNGTATFRFDQGDSINSVPINLELERNTFTLLTNQSDVSNQLGSSPIYGVFTSAAAVR